MKGIITRYRRRLLAELSAGHITTMPRITHIAFGDGGVTDDGTPKIPSEIQEALFHEVKRYTPTSIEIVGETTVRYTIVIPESELSGVAINEMALVDSAGKICAVKTFHNKVKDENVKFTFQFDDEY